MTALPGDVEQPAVAVILALERPRGIVEGVRPWVTLAQSKPAS
jgi:hypothetical protein